jgi:hypothetical protein
MQINFDDVRGANSTVIESHLESIIGRDLLQYLIVQAAMDSTLQEQTIDDVIKQILPNKITVYDRRLNDKLGSR